jgi:hypothetical protein
VVTDRPTRKTAAHFGMCVRSSHGQRNWKRDGARR